MSRILVLVRRAASLALLSMVATHAATAGTISLRWSPVADADLVGYRVSYGTSSGTYAGQQEMGLSTMATVQNLGECTTWYLAVQAYDAAGNLSPFSNEVSGWPRPIVSHTVPDRAEQGRRLTVSVTGANFQQGASLRFSDPAIVVHSTAIPSCNTITADVTVGPGAAAGPVNVEVDNPDRVYGVGQGTFLVESAIAPQVVSTDPADGAQEVDPGVSPGIVFSEAMLPSSIGPHTVRLLAQDGTAVTQALGSPALSADGLAAVLQPASRLAPATYRIEVVGGSAGVLDLSGRGMDATASQPTGFTVTSDLAGPAITDVRSASVGSTGASIVWTTDEPATSQVAWRRVGDPDYTTTEVDPALVLSHQVPLAGLTPGITYEYHARSADLAGNASRSTPDQTFTTLPGDCDGACTPCTSDAECASGAHCDGTTGTCAPGPAAPPLPIAPGAAWRLFRGLTEPPPDWSSLAFEDAAWDEEPGGFGYGQDCTATRGTALNAMHGLFHSVYLRRKFHVDAPAAVDSLVLTVDYDAGFVAYLNGIEVARRNLVGAPPPHDATALEPHGCSGSASDPHGPEVILLDPALLRTGTNVLAVQGHEDADGRGFTLAVELAAGSAVAASAAGDYDGDGRSDLALYSAGRWAVRGSGDGGEMVLGWGRVGDVPVPGDYDGDGLTDLAVVRDGQWIVRRSLDGGRQVATCGEAGDEPVPGDYDGDGETDPAAYRAGVWLVRNSADRSVRQEALGAPGHLPVPADYDGDGRIDPAVFRAGAWVVLRSADGIRDEVAWGIEGDLPVPHDFDGDGRSDLAVFRAGQWLVRRSSDLEMDAYVCGDAAGRASPLHYDGDPAADAATFRDGRWTLRPSSTGAIVLEEWGGAEDVPVSR